MTRQEIFTLIDDERARQDRIHGPSNENLQYDDYEYMTILSEENGEVCQALFNLRRDRTLENMGEYASELIQVAAVAIQILEKIPL